MNKKNNIIVGVIFIILGVLFLFQTLKIIDISFSIYDIGFLFATFWPAMFLILPGFLFHTIYFTGKSKDAGILVPGGILLVTGITCQLSMTFGIWGVTWPGYIFAVAFGLFELYLFGNREKGLLIPISILGVISLVFFDWVTLGWLFGFRIKQFIIPAVLIVIGILIIFRNTVKKTQE